ncbi:MAG: type II secretion system F family protein [Zoogloeaceae bacterium]|jgi:type IV pilus assembly protein PilC|nr:type II secretion system F family protein [Zoogloeaceae bacterium]
MSAFTYRALDARGQEARGWLDAPDEAAARRLLKERGLKVLRIAAGEAEGDGTLARFAALGRALSRLRPIGNGDRVQFFRQMQLMLKSGHTLLEALSALARLATKARQRALLERLSAAIQRGSSFAAACAEEKELFNRLAVRLIAAGEASGELGAVFERLAALLERRTEVRRQLLNAMVYPGLVLVAAIGVIAFLVISVIPRFASFLNGRGKAIPAEAQLMLDAADWLAKWGWLVGAIFLAVLIGVPLARRLPQTRLGTDRVALAIPLLGSTLEFAVMAQTSWTFGVLVKSRLTVLEALRVCKEISGNAAIARAFHRAAEAVLQGRTLALALDQRVLPRLMRHMAAVGEKSGQIDTVMETLGEYYQKALDARVKLLSSMIEPMLTLLIGGIVGFVYKAFFKAMLAVSTGG